MAKSVTRFTLHVPLITCHIWTTILVLMGHADLAEPKQGPPGVVDVLSDETDAAFARALEPLVFQFPLDHGPHPDYKIEWWYYTGNLQTNDGKDFGYQLTFFRFALTHQMPNRASNFATNQIYMGHFAVTDIARGQYFSFERFSRGMLGLAGATGTPTYEVWLEDWSVREVEPGVVRLWAVDDQANPNVAIDLTLREKRPPILHGNRGLSQKGLEPGNANYYYSLVQLETTGNITSNAQKEAVSGISWMDHEFGTSALGEGLVGWDWFSLQLDNGITLMLYCLRQSDQSCHRHTFEGTVVYPDGRRFRIGATDSTILPTDTWTSPKSGITYPSGWQVTVPELQIDLHVEPFIANQEFQGRFTYWEGAVQVKGHIHKMAVGGRGYAELTGYNVTH